MRKILKVVGLLILYFAIVLASMFLGYLSPVAWVYFPVVAAFLAASPVLIICKSWKRPGGIAIFTAFWMAIMGALGELDKLEVVVSYIIFLLAAEAIRYFIGYKKQLGSRIGYAVNCLGLAGSLLPLWTRTEYYYEGATEELSLDYANGLMRFNNPIGMASLIILTLASAYLGCIVSEKLLRISALEKDETVKTKTA